MAHATQHARHGGVIERNRAVERHVVFTHSEGDRGGYDGGMTLAHEASCAMSDLCHQSGVDLRGEMWSMLLRGPDRNDHNGITCGKLREFVRLQPRPFDLGHDASLQTGNGVSGLS